MPSESAEDIEVIRSDSAEIILSVFAPEMNRYSLTDSIYTEFPLGISLIGYIYGSYPDTAYSIKADYAINYETTELWKAEGDVVANNIDGDELHTELLYWDENKKIIYSDKFSRITTEDGIFYGENGFEAQEDFTKWKLKNINNSVVNINDE